MKTKLNVSNIYKAQPEEERIKHILDLFIKMIQKNL